jgi:hypothetical protein
MSRSTNAPLIVGGVPRADLLPPEIRVEAKIRGQRRIIVGLVALVVAVVAASCVAASILAMVSSQQMIAANDRTNEILAEQSKYIAVRQYKNQVEIAEAARAVGVSTEIDWGTYLPEITSRLSAGATIDNLTVVSSSPTVALPQGEGPLAVPSLAEITFTVSTDGFPEVATWLDSLTTIPGFADAVPSTIALESGVYKVNFMMHVDEGALSNRFSMNEAAE